MFSSLRFRLPALFLAGIALTGVVSTLIAFGLFRNYTQNQAKRELRREAAGLTQLYAEQALNAQEQGKPPPFFAASKLEAASGDRLFYVGLPFFSGQASGLRRLPFSSVDWPAIERGKTLEFTFTPPGEHRKLLAVAHPLYLDKKEGSPFGALVVATPQTQLHSQAFRLVERLAIALLVGVIISLVLAWYLSGRITRPLRRLAKAADEVAEGHYDTPVPVVPGRHEAVAMARLLEQAYAAFGEEAKQRAIEYSHEASASPVIVTDGDRVLQIITNLLANAFRWTPDGGSVDLRLSSDNGRILVAV